MKKNKSFLKRKPKNVKIPYNVGLDMIKNSIVAFADDVNQNDIYTSYTYNKLLNEGKIDSSKINSTDKAKDLVVNHFVCNYIDCTNFPKETKDDLLTFLNRLVDKK